MEGQENRKREFYANLGLMASKNFRSVGLKQFDQWNAIFPTMFEGGLENTPAVSETSAQRISTVFTCLNILGETEGGLPFGIKKIGKNGPETDYSNPVHRLVHDRPNPTMTAFTFWSTQGKLRRAWGNAFAEIKRDSNYIPYQLDILEPWETDIIQSQGSIYYRYKGRLIRATDVLHFKNYSQDGLKGISTIRQNALTLGIAQKLNAYNSSIIGERPYGYLTSQTRPKDLQQKDAQRSLWDKRSAETDEKVDKGVKSINGIPYLYGGLEFKSFTLPADDVAYIESAKLKDRDIFGIFRIPPTMAQDWENAPYNSSEQQDINFVKYSLASIKEIEQECTEKLFPESNKQTGVYYCKFSLQGLLRGDTNTRKEFYSSGIQNGWLTPNQVCEFEDLPTYGKEGDNHFLQGALVPIDMIVQMIASKSQAAPTARDIEDFKKELRDKMKSKLNGHYADIAEFLS